MTTSPHMVIRASAGSGKTYTLSNRYLKLLHQGAEPSEVLATTFTRKAAGEILGRVLTRLAHAARDKAGAAALELDLKAGPLDLAGAQRLLTTLREHIGALAISTLDSFFHRMAGCFRYELGLPRDPQLVDESHPSIRQSRREAIDAMLGDEAPQVLIDLLRRLHHDTTQRRITDAIDDVVTSLYAVYRQTDPRAWHQLVPPVTLDREQVADAIELLQGAGDSLPADARFVKAWRDNIEAARRNDWEGFLAGGLAAKLASGEETYQRKAIPPGVVAAYRPMLVHARAMIVKRVADQTESTHALLDRFHAHYTRIRREQGLLVFADLPLLLSQQVLAGDSAIGLDTLYYRLDRRVQHLLLDEFQDTSPLQWRVLRPFGEEIRAGDGVALREGAPPRSFFCVGDVKQAIYGWRDGCAEVFEEVLADLHLPPEVVKELSTSRRTPQAVLDVVNTVFESLAESPPLADLRPHVERWARGFRTHRAHDRQKRGYVRVEASPSTGEGEDAKAAHLDFVAERVAELFVAHPGRTVGVLVRKNETATTILDKLREHGVPASGEGGVKLPSDPAVSIVLSALTFADHPGHTAAAHAVRHSPLAEAVGLRRDLGVSSLSTFDVARDIRRSLLDLGYAEQITRWAQILSVQCNERSVERLSQLIELAERYDMAATGRARDFVRFVEASSVEEASPAPVQVMTVHKAKGLEFDVVVLTELGDLVGQTSRSTLWQYRRTPTSPSEAVYSPVNQNLRPIVAEHHPNFAEAHEQEVARRMADDLSRLYVAMTRPKHALHVVLEPLKRTTKGWSVAGLSNASPAAVVRHALTDVESPRADGVLFEAGDADWDERRERAAAPKDEAAATVRPTPRLAGGGAAKRGWGAVSPSRMVEAGTMRASELVSMDHREARSRGTQSHDLLASLTWLDEVDPAQLPETLREMWERPAIRALFARPAGAVGLWREKAFTFREGDQLVQGRFDRVVLERDRATIIDFKTDRANGQLQRLAEHYRPQMELYRTAAARLCGIERERVGVKLAFVRDGVVVDV